MSREWMQKTLMNLGFTESETQVYLFLQENGPHKAKDILDTLGIHRQKLYRILKKLKNKGIVNASSEFPSHFSAVLFEKVLDLFIEARIEQQEALKANKKIFSLLGDQLLRRAMRKTERARMDEF